MQECLHSHVDLGFLNTSDFGFFPEMGGFHFQKGLQRLFLCSLVLLGAGGSGQGSPEPPGTHWDMVPPRPGAKPSSGGQNLEQIQLSVLRGTPEWTGGFRAHPKEAATGVLPAQGHLGWPGNPVGTTCPCHQAPSPIPRPCWGHEG